MSRFALLLALTTAACGGAVQSIAAPSPTAPDRSQPPLGVLPRVLAQALRATRSARPSASALPHVAAASAPARRQHVVGERQRVEHARDGVDVEVLDGVVGA